MSQDGKVVFHVTGGPGAAKLRAANDAYRDEQVAGMMQDMVLSRAAKGMMLFSARKRLAEALVARGWRKADMTDTARELAEALQPCQFTPDGWCGTHSTSVGPTYCTQETEK